MSSAASGPNASSPEAGEQAVSGPDGSGTTLPGTVYLVGAGPGDPDLLTLKAHRLLSRCDALVYDSLVPRALLDLVPEGCECHFVGKRRGHHSVPQPTTNAVLVELAKRHRCIVRLKGGDPFLFGRGGEEAAHLVKQGVAVQVVPGVTAGIAAPAYAGIPVTHRRAGSSVTFVTGHEEIDKGRPGVDWRGLARSSDGLVIYMGLHNLPQICAELMAGGLAGSTPAAVVQQGTVTGQRQLITALANLAERVEAEGFGSPAIVVIGAVVAERIPQCAPEPALVEMPIPF
jgi:uroporphyrin-III C-methyltransferase